MNAVGVSTTQPVHAVAGLQGERVAIVHDYLNQRGGAEQVVLAMATMWPGAPIYTSLYRPASTFAQFAGSDVRTTPLDRLPVDEHFRALLPLYPAAFRSLGKIDADLLISSTSGWAHIARGQTHAAHAVYCHSPARWLYGEQYMKLAADRHALKQALIRPFRPTLRRIDLRAAQRADLYIANSTTTKHRIEQIYGIGAPVVNPPVDTERFRPTPRGERLLMVSRLMPYKRVDLVIDAIRQLDRSLDIVGDGPLFRDLQAIGGPRVTFHGAADDRVVAELLQACSAVCVAAEEDFGLVAVEAQAAGKPVVAYGRGGACETVIDRVTGVLFEEQHVDSVRLAILACDELATSPAVIAENAARFSRAAFAARLTACLSVARDRRDERMKLS
jgi:glycosyltransferase involved in cell wall biosynthesis